MNECSGSGGRSTLSLSLSLARARAVSTLRHRTNSEYVVAAAGERGHCQQYWDGCRWQGLVERSESEEYPDSEEGGGRHEEVLGHPHQSTDSSEAVTPSYSVLLARGVAS
jgi:hypothetical protein